MFRKSEIGGGITFLSEYIPYVHSVSMGIWVKSGSIFDHKETAGIAHFVEHMIFKGTEKRTSFDIAREIDDVGGHLNAYTSKEYTSFYVKVLKEDLKLAIDVISDIFKNSTFPKDELNREKDVVIQEIKMVEDTPDEYIHDLAFKNMWGGHSLGYSILGEIETVSSFDRDTLFEYRSAHHTRDNIIVGLVGNFDINQAEGFLNTAFGGIGQGVPNDISCPVFAPGRIIKGRDTEQVHTLITFPALPYSHPKRYAQYILNTVLGGGMSSRLFQEIREKRGLAYSVYSFLSSFKEVGTLGVYAGTDKRSVAELMDVMTGEVVKMNRIPLTDGELNSAKGQIKGNLLLSMESTDSRLSRMVRNEIFFKRQVNADKIIDRIDSITPDDVIDVAREIIDTESMCCVFMGPITEEDVPGVFN
ncbi:MAG: insulinase family protein [Deltaproteobacteria bacterium]|uniref:Insulinase family protein n=1 Tax=Candidatus Zymogenus saltonus TaxID=2844893 RepID=A0A9D8KGB1_9DELT|nr:insulinase family protein [Candidatus Zymogenus saltonus]